MVPVEHVPRIVAAITSVAGGALLAKPTLLTGPVGLNDQDRAVRLVGMADLVLVPGLLGGRPRWPWMVGRAALNLGQAAYLDGAAARSSRPGWLRGGARILVGLSLVDLSTALMLHRAGH